MSEIAEIPIPAALVSVLVILAGVWQFSVPLAVILGSMCLLLYVACRRGTNEYRQHRGELADIERRWLELSRRWVLTASSQLFDSKLAELRKARDEYERLIHQQQADLLELETSKRETMLRVHLERFRVDRARVAGIGAGRLATLSSYGIETAADIELARLLAVPGFGPKLAGDLLAWRTSLAGKFVFDSAKQVPESAKAAVRYKYEKRLMQLQETLRRGPAVLEGVRVEIESTQEQLAKEVASLATHYANIKAALSSRPPTTVSLPGKVGLSQAATPPLLSPGVGAVPNASVGQPQGSVGSAGARCPRCGATLIPRRGRYGRFYGCSAYPRCRYTRNR